MKSRLEKILDQLQNELSRAEEFADSENQKTADKYADVPDSISTAIEAIEEAIGLLET